MRNQSSPAARRAHAIALVAGALAAFGCGTDVAQTAFDAGAPAPLDCAAPSAAVELPSDARFGGTATTSDWVLARAGDYGAGQGPGVTVAALDGFRLFVNGHLVATGTSSLAPSFVPLTLLPGDNTIAVVVSAVHRTPVLLAEVDELERSYGSDASWKVSSDPPDDFADPQADDSQWAAAIDRGSVEENPACDPGPGFPAGSDAHLIAARAAGSAVFRLDVHIAPVGFASSAGTNGGGDAEPVLATTVDDIVNAVKSDDPKVVLIPEGVIDVRRTGKDVTQTVACPTPCPDDTDSPGMLTYNLLTEGQSCPDTVPATRNERRIKIGSNTTLVGLGRGAALLGGSLYTASTNVIIRNLILYGVNPGLIEAGDGITLDDGADGVWVDHVTFRLVSDGFIDSTSGSKNLTFSWLRNDGTNPAACGGRHPRSNELSDTTATIHHTLWEHVNGRAPAVTHSESLVHLFDNVVEDDAGYAVGAGCDAQVLVQDEVFEDVKFWTSKFTCSDAGDLGQISAAAGGNLYLGSGEHESADMPTTEPADSVFTPTYPYTRDPVDRIRYIVPDWAGAGARWALPMSALPAP
jgi:pectate lyase